MPGSRILYCQNARFHCYNNSVDVLLSYGVRALENCRGPCARHSGTEHHMQNLCSLGKQGRTPTNNFAWGGHLSRSPAGWVAVIISLDLKSVSYSLARAPVIEIATRIQATWGDQPLFQNTQISQHFSHMKFAYTFKAYAYVLHSEFRRLQLVMCQKYGGTKFLNINEVTTKLSEDSKM